MTQLTTENRPQAGRPPKFKEDRRPITVTLPERILRQLDFVDGDRARAIVKCVEAASGGLATRGPRVELVEVAPGQALIVVNSARSLSQIPWLRMVEVAPGRFVLVVPSGTPVETLEVAVMDLLENLGVEEEEERLLLSDLRRMIGQQRRCSAFSKGELVFVAVAPKDTRR